MNKNEEIGHHMIRSIHFNHKKQGIIHLPSTISSIHGFIQALGRSKKHNMTWIRHETCLAREADVSQTLVGSCARARTRWYLLGLLHAGLSIVDNNNDLACDEIHLFIFFPFIALMNVGK
jgi:hypothetical protein